MSISIFQQNDGGELDPDVTVIKSRSGLRLIDLRDLWNYRELIYFLTWRDVKVRYKQTALGIVWVILQPLALTLVFTMFFSRLAGLPSDGVPYALFALAGLIPWQLFSRTVSETTSSLITDQKLITRVYFPRIIVPISTTIAAIPDVLVSLIILFVVMGFYTHAITLNILWIPLIMVLLVVTVLAVGFWLSALNVEYRDVMYVVPFLIQFWMFVTPVVYSSSIVPDQWRWLYSLNPMVFVLEAFRWSILGAGDPSAQWISSIVLTLLLFFTGIAWFYHREPRFIDIIGSGGR